MIGRSVRRLLPGVLGLACLPDVELRGDAGFAVGDVPTMVCGHRDTPCCRDGVACRVGVVCRDGACRAATPRCVATGIANPDVTREVFWDESDVPGCTALPPPLLDPQTPGFYVPGDRAIGLLECEGLTPGTHHLRLQLHIRMLSPIHDVGDCQCGAPVHASLQLVLNGHAIASLPSFVRDGPDGSCRRGPDADLTFEVEVDLDGNFSARLDLINCERVQPDRCLFVRGTSMTLDPSP